MHVTGVMHELERYFPGDEAWAAFVAVHAPGWAAYPHQDALVTALGGHEDLALVLRALVGPGVMAWIDRPVPALDGLTPRICAGSPVGLMRLRSMLMRMP